MWYADMSLEELWALFPVELKPYNPDYKKWFEEEREKLKDKLENEGIYRINHIGSTAVEGLVSKPIVDILLEVVPGYEQTPIMSAMEKQGWLCMHQETEGGMKLVFNKGYTPEGFADKVYHCHIRRCGDWDELYFRDYLILCPDAAGVYGNLKEQLLETYRFNRDGYTAAKKQFIQQCTEEARKLMHLKYAPV